MTVDAYAPGRRPAVGLPPAVTAYSLTTSPRMVSQPGLGVGAGEVPVRMSRQPVVDLVVAMVSVPLLVVFGLMLESNMRGDWAADADSRWNVLGLGLALLLVSLLVCCYVTHRLGICIWSAHNRQHQARLAAAGGRHPNALTSVSSQLHLVSELPPSYDSVVGYDMPPPPYCTVLAVCDQKPPAHPAPPPQAPPPTRGSAPGTG